MAIAGRDAQHCSRPAIGARNASDCFDKKLNKNKYLRCIFGMCAVLAMTHTSAENESFSAEDFKKGSTIYSQNCSPCHGPRMLDPQGAFDLRTFPKNDSSRFITSVSKGKGQMPPFGGLLSQTDIDALWAYVFVGEKQ
jgi:mono/diheme cytochrome c family protein